MIILFNLLLPLAFAITPPDITPATACEGELIKPDAVTTVEVRLDGFEAVEKLLRSLPPASAHSGLRRVLDVITRRLRYGLAPDITGDVLANLHGIKVDFDQYGGWARGEAVTAFQVTLSRAKSRKLSATGFGRRFMFPHWRGEGDQLLAYAQRMVISSGVENGRSTISLTLVVELRGNLDLLTPKDRALIERARVDSSTLLPTAATAIEHQAK